MQLATVSTTENRHHFTLSTPTEQLRGSLNIPFAAGLNRHVDAVRVQNHAWAVGHRLACGDVIARCQIEQLAALGHHDCGYEDLAHIANFYTTLFVLDDMLDNKHSVIGSSVELTEHVTGYWWAAAGGGPRPRLGADVPEAARVVDVGNALADLTRRLMVKTDREGIRHYLDDLRVYLEGCVRESRRRTDMFTSVEDCVDLRLRVSAVYACLECEAIIEQCQVPDAVRNDAAFARMRTTCNQCVSVVNDIFSYVKEAQAGETCNAVIIHQMVHGMSASEALRASIELSDKAVCDYFEARQELESRHEIDDSIRGYINMLQNWMRGNFDWYHELRTRRYTDCLTTATPVYEM